jgi:hypothetical protein
MSFMVFMVSSNLVTNLMTKAEPLSYADLHSHLLTYEFLHKTSLLSMDTISPLLPQPLLLSTPSAHLATSQHKPISVVTRVVIVATSVPTATAITTKISLTIVASIPPLLWLEAEQLVVEQAPLWVWTVVLSPVFWVECQVTIVFHFWPQNSTLCTTLG